MLFKPILAKFFNTILLQNLQTLANRFWDKIVPFSGEGSIINVLVAYVEIKTLERETYFAWILNFEVSKTWVLKAL